MAYPEFPTTLIGPELGYKKTVEPRLKGNEFGDGYTQDTPDGINFMLASWELAWPALTPDEFSTLETFIKDRKGCETFLWTAPDGNTYKVKCRAWTTGHPYPSIFSFEGTFKEAPL